MGRITLDKVTKSFGDVQVIPPLDLTIEEGEFVVFVGPSGCGKSTLLRLIAGLEDVSGGQIRIDGQDATRTPPAKRGLAMVFQSYALYPHMSVRKNIAFPLRMAGMDKAEIDSRVARAADILGLKPYLARYPRELSGGQRQRVAMGRAMVRDAAVFLFDEPLSNLDAKLRAQMRVEIRQLHDRLGATTIYVTHDQIEAMTMADVIVLMRDGRIEQIGSPDEVYDRPASKYVADFIGTPGMNFLDGEIVAEGGAAVFRAPQIRIALPQDFAGRTGPALCGLRPADLKLDADGAIEGRLTLREKTGADEHLHLSVGAREIVAVAPRHAMGTDGQTIRLTIDPRKAHFFDSATERRIG